MMNFKRAAVALALVIGVQSQAGVGLHGGVNLADVSAPGPTVSTTEIMLGAFYESKGDLFHFQPEFNYVKKGYANYIVVPLLLKVKFETPVIKPYLLAGPAPAFKVEGAGAKAFDLSIDAGGGIELEIAPKLSILAEARYSLGIVNVNDLSVTSVKTRGIHILGGIHFSL